MTVAEEIITIMGDNITVDLLVWRKFRRPMPGYVEKVMDINPNLPDVIEYIPVGTKVVLPAVDLRNVESDLSVVALWQ